MTACCDNSKVLILSNSGFLWLVLCFYLLKSWRLEHAARTKMVWGLVEVFDNDKHMG